MVYLYWDFENNEVLKKFDPLKRVGFIQALKEKMKIPVSYHVSGFDNPYIEIESNDPAEQSPAWKDGMIPRAGHIQVIRVRHLTHQKEEYIERIQKIAEEVFKSN